MEIKLGERLVRHWGIQGRATNILEVKPECFPPCIPSKLKEQLECQGMVGKLLWVQSKRVLESEILEEIPKRMVGIPEEDQAAVKGHIPDLIASKTFPECETRKIREDLGIDVEDIENRVLILSIFRKLKPITELEYDDFWRAWWDCVLCHLVLWTIGIRHRDISAGNLMYYRHRGRVMGVLNDYDLSTLIRPGYEEGPTGTDRTGTVPFMALDLLESSALAGNVEHQYQHDFEAFLWVLTWITHRYQEGRMMSHAPFNAWIADHQQCRKEKSTYQADLVKNKQPLPPPTSSHESVWWKCGKILLRMSFLVSVNDENLPEARDYFNRMKKGIEESGKDLTVNSLDEL
ncbi:hypothetical protein FRC03_001474 [Tulasnella sp. 419]|nr:hypothetical protein FRC03_001474 [Tulasnella sp. 419]